MDISNRTVSAVGKRDDAVRRWYKSPVSSVKGKSDIEDFIISFDKGAMLFGAVTSGDLEETERILSLGADPDYRNADGLSSLHQACIDESLEMVALLIKYGANVNSKDNESWTPLHAAASSTSIEVIKFLLKNGADIAAINSDDDLPIDLAEEPHIKNFLSREMKTRGINVDDARAKIHTLMTSDIKNWVSDGNLAKGTDPQGGSILHVAASKGYTDIVETILVSTNVDVNSTDQDGWTPLHAAVYWKHKDIISLLISYGADVNAKTKNNLYPSDLADQEILMFYKLAIKRSNSQAYSSGEEDKRSVSEQSPMFPHMYKKPVKSILKAQKEDTANKIELPIKETAKPVTANIPKPSLPPCKISKPIDLAGNHDDSKAEISSFDLAAEIKKPPTLPPTSVSRPPTKSTVSINYDSQQNTSLPSSKDLSKSSIGIKLPSTVPRSADSKDTVRGTDAMLTQNIKLPPSISKDVGSGSVKDPDSKVSLGIKLPPTIPIDVSSGSSSPKDTNSRNSSKIKLPFTISKDIGSTSTEKDKDIRKPSSINVSAKTYKETVSASTSNDPDVRKLSNMKLPPTVSRDTSLGNASNDKDFNPRISPGIKLPPSSHTSSIIKNESSKDSDVSIPSINNQIGSPGRSTNTNESLRGSESKNSTVSIILSELNNKSVNNSSIKSDLEKSDPKNPIQNLTMRTSLPSNFTIKSDRNDTGTKGSKRNSEDSLDSSSTNNIGESVSMLKQTEKSISCDDASLIKKYNDAKQDIYNLRSRINSMKKEIETLKEQNEVLQSQLSSIEKLKKENERLTKENKTLINAMTLRNKRQSD